jgi:hypothetical protein
MDMLRLDNCVIRLALAQKIKLIYLAAHFIAAENAVRRRLAKAAASESKE